MKNPKLELWILTAVAIFCGVVSLFIPPKGAIHSSVIQFIGWLFAFGALYTIPAAIKAGVGFKATTKAGTVEIGARKKDGKQDCENDNNGEK